VGEGPVSNQWRGRITRCVSWERCCTSSWGVSISEEISVFTRPTFNECNQPRANLCSFFFLSKGERSHADVGPLLPQWLNDVYRYIPHYTVLHSSLQKCRMSQSHASSSHLLSTPGTVQCYRKVRQSKAGKRLLENS